MTGGTWITFDELDPAPKTRRWQVTNRATSEALGTISWFGRWRKYAFHPAPGMVFEEVCLRDIAEFCAVRTAEHRAAAKERRATTST